MSVDPGSQTYIARAVRSRNKAQAVRLPGPYVQHVLGQITTSKG